MFMERWIEKRFEAWFEARFDRWIDARLGGEFDKRLKAWTDDHLPDRFETLFAEGFDQHMHAWADSQLPERFQPLFTAGFDSRITAWKDSELKREFDAWVAHWFDNLFTVWANTWADGDDFRERFVQNFVAQLQDRLDSEVKARVANEIYTLIDRRIEQWLLAEVRKPIHWPKPPPRCFYARAGRPKPPRPTPPRSADPLPAPATRDRMRFPSRFLDFGSGLPTPGRLARRRRFQSEGGPR